MKVDIDISKTYIGRAHLANGTVQDVPCSLTDVSEAQGLAPGTVIAGELLGSIGDIYFGAGVVDGEVVFGDYVMVALNATRAELIKGEFMQLDESTGEYVNVVGIYEVIKKIDNKFIDFPITSSVKENDKRAVSSAGVYEHVRSEIANANNYAKSLFDGVPNSIEQRDLVYDVTLTDEVSSVYATILKEFNSISKYAKRLFVHIEVPANDYEDNALYIKIPVSGTGTYLYALNKFVPLNNTTFVDAQIEHIGGQSIFSLYSFFNSSDNPSYDNPTAVTAYKENKMEVRSFVTTSSLLSPTGFYGIRFEARIKLPVGTKIKVWGEYEV